MSHFSSKKAKKEWSKFVINFPPPHNIALGANTKPQNEVFIRGARTHLFSFLRDSHHFASLIARLVISARRGTLRGPPDVWQWEENCFQCLRNFLSIAFGWWGAEECESRLMTFFYSKTAHMRDFKTFCRWKKMFVLRQVGRPEMHVIGEQSRRDKLKRCVPMTNLFWSVEKLQRLKYGTRRYNIESINN